MRIILLDTGVLWAALDRSDKRHAQCGDLLDAPSGHLVVPSTVLTETCWHIEKNLGAAAEADFLDSVAGGELQLLDVTTMDLIRAAELVRTYSDLRLGLVDASVIALAERLNVREIATLDRRHFTVVRPRHIDAFTLLPQ